MITTGMCRVLWIAYHQQFPNSFAWLLVGTGEAGGRSTAPAGGQGDCQAWAQFQPVFFLSLCTCLQ